MHKLHSNSHKRGQEIGRISDAGFGIERVETETAARKRRQLWLVCERKQRHQAGQWKYSVVNGVGKLMDGEQVSGILAVEQSSSLEV